MVESPKRLTQPWYQPLRLLQWLAITLLVLVAVFYGLICLTLYQQQNVLTYPGQGTHDLSLETIAEKATKAGVIPWAHPTPGATSPQGYVAPNFADPAPRGTIVIFHGNAAWAMHLAPFVATFKNRGFRTFLYEYPGYGARPGHPSEATIVPDARALIRSLDAAGYGPVYVWGESLGSGVASAVCGDPTLPVHGLVILTAWDTIADVGLYRYPYIPVRQLMIDRYDSIANLSHFGHPICVVRCTQDQVIPPSLTINLYDHLPEPKKLIVQEGVGHDDWPRGETEPWWDEALNFIAPK